jgi:protein-serine/threonine kinase
LCIITELCEGGSLYTLLHSDAAIDETLLAKIIKGIAAGMMHLHAENIVHRDLAARNILVSITRVYIYTSIIQ